MTLTSATTALAHQSIALINRHQDPSGAYPASPTFSAYRGYSWLRDGAFIADGMSTVGERESAHRFFDWCAATTMKHADRITAAVTAAASGSPLPDSQMLPARFTFDGSFGTDPWWDFQLDGYGTWLWALGGHVTRHGLDPAVWAASVELTVDYLCSSWHRPCYDWWEEHAEQVHISTLGCIGAGLEAVVAAGLAGADHTGRASETAAQIRAYVAAHGMADGHLVKWVGRNDVDGSLASLIAPLGWLRADDPAASTTLAAIDRQLAVSRGVHRFGDDVFYGGGQWPILTSFFGLASHAIGDETTAADCLRWVAGTARDDGSLPEQVDGHLLAPQERAAWIERWGPVATPLLWSHGMFLRLWDALDRP